MSEKEPGQLLHELSAPVRPWAEITDMQRDYYVTVEAAVRADERAKALDEAAKVIDEWPDEYPGVSKHSPEYYECLDRDIAIITAIRAMIAAAQSKPVEE